MKAINQNTLGTLVLFFLAVNIFAQPSPPGGGGGGTNTYTYIYTPPPYAPRLKASVALLNRSNLQIKLLESDPAGMYAIYSATGLNSITWSNTIQGTNGQTNFTFPLLYPVTGFCRIARTDTPVTNTASMTVTFPNPLVNTHLVSALITNGPAACMAVLVNDTNTADARWIPFSSVPLVLLGTNDGTYQVLFGFIGSDGQTNWTSASVTVDTTPPHLVVTGPTNGLVAQPIIQLTGYCPEALQSISYDLTNAAGLLTNQQVLILDQHYDAGTWGFTTNTFQAFDVALTNGVNRFTFHATDLAGNMTTLTTNFTLDYSGKTNPPVVQIIWPQDGTTIAGDNFTVRGWVDDFTVTVTAQMVDTNGVTNLFTGMVERNGRFWLDNLPLAGTNNFTVAVTDAAGNVSKTNLTVIRSSLVLTMNAVSDPSQLWQPTASVSGMVSDPAYSIWVNGVHGTNNRDGTWSADNVPVTAGGVASFDVSAVNDGDPAISTNWDKPVRLYQASDLQNLDSNTHEWCSYADNDNDDDFIPADESYDTLTISHYEHDWTDATGGRGSYRNFYQYGEFFDSYFEYVTNSGVMFWTSADSGVETDTDYWGGMTTNNIGRPAIGNEHCSVSDPKNPPPLVYVLDGGDVLTNTHTETYTRTAQTKWRLETGGRAGVGRKSLWLFSGGATEITNKRAVPCFNSDDGRAIPPSHVFINGHAMDTNGIYWTTLPDGTNFDVTPFVAGKDFYTFNVGAQKYMLTIFASSYTTNADLSVTTPEFCVGQNVTFSPVWIPETPPYVDTVQNWHLPTKFVNDHTNAVPGGSLPGSSENYFINGDLLTSNSTSCWYVNGQGGSASIGMNLHFSNGQYVSLAAKGDFTVYRPNAKPNKATSGIWYLDPRNVTLDTNWPSVLALDNFRLQHYVAITSKYAGLGNYVQLLSATNLSDFYPYSINTGGEIVLDNTNPYNDASMGGDTVINENEKAIITLHDQPQFPGVYTISIDMAFKDYLIFQPTGSDSIWVTLGRVNWSWTAGAWYDSSWHTNNYCPPPIFNGDDTFPYYEHTLYNFLPYP